MRRYIGLVSRTLIDKTLKTWTMDLVDHTGRRGHYWKSIFRTKVRHAKWHVALFHGFIDYIAPRRISVPSLLLEMWYGNSPDEYR